MATTVRVNKPFDYEKFDETDILGEDFWDQMSGVIPKRGPLIDIYKTDHEYLVIIEAPGLISLDAIHIKNKGHQLLLNGEIPWPFSVEKENLIRQERFIGSFNRTIELPGDASFENISQGQYKNGLIFIKIGRIPDSDIHDIPIHF